jgi:hypothetical protein
MMEPSGRPLWMSGAAGRLAVGSYGAVSPLRRPTAIHGRNGRTSRGTWRLNRFGSYRPPPPSGTRTNGLSEHTLRSRGVLSGPQPRGAPFGGVPHSAVADPQPGRSAPEPACCAPAGRVTRTRPIAGSGRSQRPWRKSGYERNPRPLTRTSPRNGRCAALRSRLHSCGGVPDPGRMLPL